VELVAGANLRRWLAASAPTPETIIATLLEAGRGLAAAHAAGLVHGDTNPEEHPRR